MISRLIDLEARQVFTGFTGDLQQRGNVFCLFVWFAFYWNYNFLSIEKEVHSLEAEEITWESRQWTKDKMLNFYWRCSQIFVLMNMPVVCMHVSMLVKVLLLCLLMCMHTRACEHGDQRLTSGGFLDHSPLYILRQDLPLESTAS